MSQLNGKHGTAFRDGEAIATFELHDDRHVQMIPGRYGEPPWPGRQTGQVEIAFLSIEPSAAGMDLDASLSKYRARQERCPPFALDVKLDDGTDITGCSVHSAWAGNRFTLSIPD